MNALENAIENLWAEHEKGLKINSKEHLEIIDKVYDLLDQGRIRVCEKQDQWKVNVWIKKAILLSFAIWPNRRIDSGPGQSYWWDKVPMKLSSWEDEDFLKSKFRAVPGAIVRKGAFVAENAVLMPSFINVGAYVGERTMVDTWSTIGSCAQIGRSCHISGGVGIGGVLEPLQSEPVIIEDHCFIGARSEIAEGVQVGEGAVIGMGVYLGKSTKIIDRHTHEVFYGRVPPYSVVVPGSYRKFDQHQTHKAQGDLSLNCAVIIKKVDERTRSKTGINQLLRDE